MLVWHGPCYLPLTSDSCRFNFHHHRTPWQELSLRVEPAVFAEHGTNVTSITAFPEAEGMCIRCVSTSMRICRSQILDTLHRNHFVTQLYMDYPPLRTCIHAFLTLFSPRTFVHSYLLL